MSVPRHGTREHLRDRPKSKPKYFGTDGDRTRHTLDLYWLSEGLTDARAHARLSVRPLSKASLMDWRICGSRRLAVFRYSPYRGNTRCGPPHHPVCGSRD